MLDDPTQNTVALLAVVGLFGEALGLSDDQIGDVLEEAHQCCVAKLRADPAPPVERIYAPILSEHVN